MLKQLQEPDGFGGYKQPPSGGCVLKHRSNLDKIEKQGQPPSGGCVLKLALHNRPFV